MLVSKLFGLFDSVPRAVNNAYSSFLYVLEVLTMNCLFGKGWEDNASEFFLLVFDVGQQLESLHFFTCTLLGIAVIKVHHKKRYCLFRLYYFLPFAFFLLFFLVLPDFYFFIFFWFIDIGILQLLLDRLFLLFIHKYDKDKYKLKDISFSSQQFHSQHLQLWLSLLLLLYFS